MWANPNNMEAPTSPYQSYPSGYALAQSPVPMSTHLHGAEVQSASDGGPNAWYTYNGIRGADYSTYMPADTNAIWYHYPNEQGATTLWYHDHAMGLTRINVYSGMAGFYLLRNATDPVAAQLPLRRRWVGDAHGRKHRGMGHHQSDPRRASHPSPSRNYPAGGPAGL